MKTKFRKEIKRFLSVLLTACMLLSMLTCISISAVAESTFDSGLLRYGNGDFELGDPLIGVWSGSKDRTNEEAFEGDYSLKVTKDGTSNRSTITMDCFPAGIGFDLSKTYMLSAWVKVTEAGARLEGNPNSLWVQYNNSGQIPFNKDNGELFDSETITEWTHVTAKLTGATDAGWLITIWCTNENYFIDNISLVEVPTFDSGLLRYGNGDFEFGDPLIGVWSGSRERVYGEGYNSGYALKVIKDGTNNRSTITMDCFDYPNGFTLSKTYMLSAWIKVTEAGTRLEGNPNSLWAQYNNSGQIPFYKDNGELFDSETATGWTHVTAKLTGATDEGWLITIWCTNENYLIDNISLSEVKAFDSGLLRYGNGDFELGDPLIGLWGGSKERTSEDAYEGNFSLKVTKDSGNQSVITMDCFPAGIGFDLSKTYMLSAWVKVTEAGARLNGNPYSLWAQYNDGSGQIPFYKDDGTLLDNETTTGWTHVSARLKGATSEGWLITLWCTNENYLIDNISLSEVKTFDSGLLRYGNGDFEFGDPLIGLWSGSRERVYGEGYNSNYALKVTKNGGTQSTITMDCFPANEGFDLSKTYMLSAWVKVTNAGERLNGNPYSLWAQYNDGSGQIPFYKDDGTLLDNETTTGWTHVRAKLKGATSDGWLITIWCTNEDYLIDNISLTEYSDFDSGLLRYGNGDFEFGDPLIGLWSGSKVRTNEDAYDGDFSLKVTKNGGTQSTITMDCFPANEGFDLSKTYMLSAWVKVTNAGERLDGNPYSLWAQYNEGSGHIPFYKDDGTLLDNETTTGWTHVRAKLKGATSAGWLVTIWCTNEDYLIDNISLTEYSDFDSGLLRYGNGDMEFGQPNFGVWKGSFERIYGDGYESNCSVKVTKDATSNESTITMDCFEYPNGFDLSKGYTLSAWIKVTEAGERLNENPYSLWAQYNDGSGQIPFYKDDGTLFDNETTTGWTHVTADLRGATSEGWLVTIWCTNENYLIDNISLTDAGYLYSKISTSITTNNDANITYLDSVLKAVPYTFEFINGETHEIHSTTVKLEIYDTRFDAKIGEENFIIDSLAANSNFTKQLRLSSSNVCTSYKIIATVSNDNFTKVYTHRISRLDKKPQGLNDYLGVLTHIAQHQGSASKLDTITDIGFGWVNDDIVWNAVELKKGEYTINQNIIDYVNYAYSKGLKIRLNISGLNDLYDNGQFPESEEAIKAFADMCKFVAETFKGKIAGYEIYSEWAFSYVSQGYSAQEYIDVLAPAYEAIKATDPDAKVAALGLLRDWDEGFFHNFLQWDGADYCDVIDIHPYELYNNPKTDDVEGYVESVLEIMDIYGVEKPLWVGEIGWSSSTELPSNLYSCTETEQAAAIMKSYFILKQFPQIEMVQLYVLEDGFGGTGDFESNFGLFDYDLKSAKLAVNAVNTVLNNLGDIAFVSKVNLNANVKAYRFTNTAGKSIMAIWSIDGKTYQIKLNANGNASVENMDFAGNKSSISANSEKIAVNISNSPIVLTSDNAITTLASISDPVALPDSPIITQVTKNSITVKSIDGYEYSIDGIAFGSENAFTGLIANKEYIVYQRKIGESEYTYIKVVTDGVSPDIDGDGVVNADDIAELVHSLLYDSDYNEKFDINNDGAVNLLDLVKLKKLIANI